MKNNIHPQVHNDVTVTCACGNTFTTTSTQKEITVEICSACHPFYTGQQKFVDTEGRIEKFARKLKETEAKKEAAKNKGKKNATTKGQEEKLTLKEMLQKAKTATHQTEEDNKTDTNSETSNPDANSSKK